MTTDRDWEQWGASDPYFGVLSVDKFRSQKFSESTLQEFFATGEAHVQMILQTIQQVLIPEFNPHKVMDFGCGVGRLLIPFARRSDVVGVDISPSMLRVAGENCAKHNIGNVELVQSDDALSGVKDRFDLVHSCLVLQHIPWIRGRKLVDELLKRVRPNGVVVLQFYYRCSAPRLMRALVELRYRFRLVNAARNLWRGRPLFEPAMQLHVYDVSLILRLVRDAGFSDVFQRLGTEDNGAFESTILFARRTGDDD